MPSSSDIDIAFGTFAILFAFLLLLVIPQHVRVRNTGTLLMAGWGFVGLLSEGISAFLFLNTTAGDEATLRWCDLAGALAYAYPFGYAAGTLAVLRRLESIASTRQVSQTPKEKKTTLFIDLSIGIGGPLLLILLHYCVQGHRMDIVGNYGCSSPLYYSIPAILVFCIWQVVINAASFIYALLVLRWFILRRRQFAAILHSSGSGMSQRRYIRLMLLASVEIFLTFPISLYIFICNAKEPLEPWIGWAGVHYGFSNVNRFMIDDLPTSLVVPAEIGRWLGILAVFVFLCFFGPTNESATEFTNLKAKIVKRLGRSRDLPERDDRSNVTTTSGQIFQNSAISFDEESKIATPISTTGAFFETHELNNYDGATNTNQERQAYESKVFVRIERVVA